MPQVNEVVHPSRDAFELAPDASIKLAERDRPYIPGHSIRDFYSLRHAVSDAAVVASLKGRISRNFESAT